MKKASILVLSLSVLILLSSCTAVIDALSYKKTIEFQNKSAAWIKLTVSDGNQDVEYDIAANDKKTLKIKSVKPEVTITVEGPYFSDYTAKIDFADNNETFAIEPNAGLVYVKNTLDCTISEVSFLDSRSGMFVEYNEDLTVSKGRSIESGKTKVITVKEKGTSKADVFFEKPDGKEYFTVGNNTSSELGQKYSFPKAGGKLELEIKEGRYKGVDDYE